MLQGEINTVKGKTDTPRNLKKRSPLLYFWRVLLAILVDIDHVTSSSQLGLDNLPGHRCLLQ